MEETTNQNEEEDAVAELRLRWDLRRRTMECVGTSFEGVKDLSERGNGSDVSVAPVQTLEEVEDWEEARDDDGDAKEKRRYLQESIQLLYIFPEDVWAAILERVEAPEDLESLSNASLFFRKILFDNRVVFLFPKVMMLLGDPLLNGIRHEFEQWQYSTSAEVKVQKCNSCGRSRTQHWFSGLLSLRLVCSLWCSGMDQWTGRSRNQLLNCGSCEFSWADCHLYDNIPQFLQHFSQTHVDAVGVVQRSPFLSGCVRLEYGKEFRQGNEVFPLLLSLYGHHILCFLINDHTLAIGRDMPYLSSLGVIVPWTSRQCYLEIRQFLGMMPRLKRFDHFIQSQYEESSVGEGTRLQEQDITLYPLPTIPSLECCHTDLQVKIFNEIIRSNSQLTILDVERIVIRDEPFLYSLPSLHLKELRFQFHSERDFEMLGNVNWPLKKLNLRYSGNYFEWSKVFHVLGNKAWQFTLRDLNLHFPMDSSETDRTAVRNSILKECSGFRLQLDRVKHLEMWMNYLCSLDFLLPMKETLENLDLSMDLSLDNLDGDLLTNVAMQQVILFVGYSERMYESNIWKLFPKLKFCKVNGPWHSRFFYSREEWSIRTKNGTQVDAQKIQRTPATGDMEEESTGRSSKVESSSDFQGRSEPPEVCEKNLMELKAKKPAQRKCCGFF